MRTHALWPLTFILCGLAACTSSYDEAAEAFFANRAPAPTPGGSTPPPASGSFGPNFSEIQAAVFTPDCATSGCHAGGSPAASLNLEAANSFMALVSVASTQDAAILRVAPGNPTQSYLIQKLEGTAATGQQMPPSGALAQSDIDTIKQWITDGAIDDRAQASTPVRVSALSLTPNSTLDSGPGTITVGFDREVDASTLNANTFLLDGSGDGTFDNGNDVSITAASISVPSTNLQSAVFDLGGASLTDDVYRIRLLGTGASVVMDNDANALDGEFSGSFPSGNGTAGGNFSTQFTVATPVALGPTLDQIQGAIFSPDCATSGCHNATTMAAGLSLANADTSFAELVDEFSNQVGQQNVKLVEPGNPDASYLIRKMENAAGITGDVMPPAQALPQSEIDVIRQWITDGAVR
jgi:hypothetical protein